MKSTDPLKVGSVFVLFGKADEFQDTESLGEIVKVIQPDKLRSHYVGYVEYELVPGDEGTTWNQLGLDLPSQITLDTEKEPGALAFSLGKGLLKLHPELGMAIVLRTVDNEFRMKKWDHAVLAEAEYTLVIDVTSGGIKASNN